MPPLEPHRLFLPMLAALILAIYAVFDRSARVRTGVVGAAMFVLFAVGMDQVSARLCPEYFTVLHNPIPGLSDPTLTGVVWGFLGSFPGGFLIGFTLAVAGELGAWPRQQTSRARWLLLLVVASTAAGATITGFSAWLNLRAFGIVLLVDAPIPPDSQRWAYIVGTYHMAAYAVAAGTTLAAVGSTVWHRRSLQNAGPSVHVDEL